MKTTRKSTKPVSAEAIAKLAERGKDASKYFTNAGQMMPPVQRVNVDFSQELLNELGTAARELNLSRQAVIKTFLQKSTGEVSQ